MSKIKVYAVVSFEHVRKGDVAEVEFTPRIKALIERGYLRKLEDVGLFPPRSVGHQSRKSPGRSKGVGDRLPASNEPSEDSDSGGHGEAEIVDPVES